MLIRILHGTLDLMILRTLASMGPQHAYAIANRLQQISDDASNLNQGTIYPALVRVEQRGWTRGSWGKTENGREAKYYSITRAEGFVVRRDWNFAKSGKPAAVFQKLYRSEDPAKRSSQTEGNVSSPSTRSRLSFP